MIIRDHAPWRTSSYTKVGETCVEVADLAPHGWWAVRDSKDPAGPKLRFPAAQWSAFTAGLRAGEFD